MSRVLLKQKVQDARRERGEEDRTRRGGEDPGSVRGFLEDRPPS